MSDKLELLIGADILPNEYNESIFFNNSSKELLGEELSNRIAQADFRIFNLEGPLTNIKSPILKSGPVISGSEESIHGIKSINPDLLVLSNNHILDEGQSGVERTVSILEKNKISYIGIGKTEKERRKSYIFEKKDIKVGIYNCCEHEFSISDEGMWGANPYDPLYAFDDIRELKNNCDFIIVLYHGGKEYFRYPAPILQRIFRKFSDSGADVVIAQHTHCIGAAENYNESLLVYGQGNFLFDTEESEFENTSLLVSLKISNDRPFAYDFIPICKNKYLTRLASEAEKSEILKLFNERSEKLNDETFIRNAYTDKALEYLRGYLLNMHIGNKLDTIFIRLYLRLPLKLRRKFFKKTLDKLLATLNYFSCESHRDLLIEGLKNII